MITVLQDSSFVLNIDVPKGTYPILNSGEFALEIVFPDRTKKLLVDQDVNFFVEIANTDLVDGKFSFLVSGAYTSTIGFHRINILSDSGSYVLDRTSRNFTHLGTLLYKVIFLDTNGSVRV